MTKTAEGPYAKEGRWKWLRWLSRANGWWPRNRMPSYEEVIGQNYGRMSVALKLEVIEFLYNMQARLSTFDLSIDNTQIPAAEIARKLQEW